MKVPDKLFAQWQDLRTHGDGKKIAQQNGITEMDVTRAFNTQECSDDTFKAIADFYKDKQEIIEAYMPKVDSTVNK